jgi:hypothetical protein
MSHVIPAQARIQSQHFIPSPIVIPRSGIHEAVIPDLIRLPRMSTHLILSKGFAP